MKKWKFKNETPRFDGEYLCHIRVTEECGNKYKKYKIVVNTFNTWVVAPNEEVLAWKELYDYPIDENKAVENYTETLQGLVSDVNNLLSEYDIEWQQAGYLNYAKQLLKNETNKLQRN